MIDDLLEYIAPHHCYGCSKTGALLCDNCKYDIISEPFLSCVACGRNVPNIRGICQGCKVPYARAWCVGARTEALRSTIDHYKFMNSKAAYKQLAALLDEYLPVLPSNTIVIPIPTIPSHIRQRGYDHMYLIARRFAKIRNLQLSTGLARVTTTKQRDATARMRETQAKAAFSWRGEFDDAVTYLLIDDVITTGATLKYAAKTVKDAGASRIWVAAICRQPLD